MSKLNDPKSCLICKEQYKIMIHLEQILNDFGTLTVAQVLQSLHFLSISDAEKLCPFLCVVCMAKIKSCYDFKMICHQLEKKMGNVTGGSGCESAPAPFYVMNPYSNYYESLKKTTTENGYLEKINLKENGKNFNVAVKNEDIASPISSRRIFEDNELGNLNFKKMTKIKEEIDDNIEDTYQENVSQESNTMKDYQIKSEIEIDTSNTSIKKESYESINNLQINETDKKVRKKRHACPVCQKRFVTRWNMRQHYFIHTGEKPHVCDICSKSFNASTSLTRHRLIHTGEKPNICDVCNKSFASPTYLKSHKLIHIGEKPHYCDICNKSLTTTSNLTKHKMIHVGEKPYVCDVCNKSYFHPRDLKKHKLVHEGIRLYVCDVCDKSLASARNLQNHKLIHNKVKKKRIKKKS